MVIDAHQHFWKYDAEQFGWIDDSMSVLRRDFLPGHLETVMRGAGVNGAVTVQAIETVEESEWLLSFADRHAFLLGVVGWAPLIDPDVKAHLEKLAANPKFKGVRHILQAEPDDRFMLREDFNRGVSALREFGLAYDILIHERHLPQTIEFVDRHPHQPFVIDHLAKPRVKDGLLSPWRERITELARRENVCSKLSGLVTEAGYRSWTLEQIHPYMEIVLEAFSPRRLMFGSDWPVCLAAASYKQWFDTVKDFTSGLSESERQQVLGGTAAAVYKLNSNQE
jgi:L-fuconolactonase